MGHFAYGGKFKWKTSGGCSNNYKQAFELTKLDFYKYNT